jgi:hypothetical protein
MTTMTKLVVASHHYSGYNSTDGDKSWGYAYPIDNCTNCMCDEVTHIVNRPDVTILSNDERGSSATWDAEQRDPFVFVREEEW